MIRQKKILVGLSGGVDSSVVAGVLRREKFFVAGVFFRLWKFSSPGKLERRDEDLARATAKKLGIDFFVADASSRFKETVVNELVREYERGLTPNPCVFCNKDFKFRILLEEATRLGFDLVATGHYARLKKKSDPEEAGAGKTGLFQAKDKKKDQSYFLYRLGQKEISKVIFPLGSYTKEEVRNLAREMKLPTFEKKESQDLCFVSKEKFENFLKENIPTKEGEFRDLAGNFLGKNEGYPFYTIGQRKGIGIGGEGPLYVFSKDCSKNSVKLVGKEDERRLWKKYFTVEKINWVSGKPVFPLRALVKTRYRQKSVYGIIEETSKRGISKVFLEDFQRAITPGQSAVFYSEREEVLGGGIIRYLDDLDG